MTEQPTVKFIKPKEPQVNPDNPWDGDVSQGKLKEYANFLTTAITADNESFILNVNAPWGHGKTFFVKRWAKYLEKQGYPVIEFNAWENDSAQDPLPVFLATIIQDLKGKYTNSRITQLKQKGGRLAMGLGGIAVRAGLRKILGDDGAKDIKDIFSKETEKELIELSGKLVDNSIKQLSAEKDFKEEFGRLVGNVAKKTKMPVFIFIDEIDRCRPTFAIEMLERIKHVFSVPYIKFIVSTDTTQLSHSICAIYGEKFDGMTYLQRFFEQTFSLPKPSAGNFAKRLFRGGIGYKAKEYAEWIFWRGVNREILPSMAFAIFAQSLNLSLREQEQVFIRLKVVIANLYAQNKSHFVLWDYLVFMLMLRLKYHELYSSLSKVRDRVQRESLFDDFCKGKYIDRNLNIQYVREVVIAGHAEENFSDMYHKLDKKAQLIENDLGNSRRLQLSDVQLLEYMMWVTSKNIMLHFDLFQQYPAIIELANAIDIDARDKRPVFSDDDDLFSDELLLIQP